VLKKLLFAIVALIVAVTIFYVGFPEKFAEVAINAERSRSHLAREETDTAGGLHWVYLEGGSGEPLLLIHGFGADKDNWTRVSRFLTPKYHVIAPDLQGFGESSKSQTASYAIAAQVETLRAFVQKLGLKRVHLGGSSMGGDIAATWAAKYPDEVSSLWLVGPAGISTVGPSELDKIVAAGGKNPLVAKTPEEFYGIFNFVMTDPPFIPKAVLKVMAERRIANFDLEQRIFKDIRSSPALEGQIAGLATPTRVLWGDHDRALNYEGAQVFVRLMPKASATIMPGAGHLPMIERPRAAAEDYLDFRAQLK
jgi:pimeloyl-ACP methyl ester carboxylesterase